MSIRVMTWVWENAKASGTDLLVLLAIADNANDDGTDAWPSEATLAEKTRVSTRTVRRCIRTLEANGALVVEQHKGGFPDTRPDRRPNRYTLVMTGGQSVRADTGGTNGRTSATERADTDVRITVLEPSKEPSMLRPKAKRATSLPDDCPDLDAIRWAHDKYPELNLELEAERFRDHHLAKGSTFKDWSAAWRTWTSNAEKWQTQRAIGKFSTTPRSVGDRNLITAFGGIR